MMPDFFTGATLIAVIAYISVQLKEIPSKVWNHIRKYFVFSATIEETTDLYKYFETWLADNHSNTLRKILLTTTFNKEGDECLHRGHIEDVFIIRYCSKRLLISKKREKLDSAKDIFTRHFNNYTIEGWYAKAQILQLMEDVMEYNQSIKHPPVIYSNNSDGYWQRVGYMTGKSIDQVFLEGKPSIVNDIQKFIKEEEWYIKRGLSYKRGYIFHGEPGNGKTSLSIAIAKMLGRDLYVINLNDLTKDSYLIRTFCEIKPNSILLVEDADVILGNRKDNDSKLSFSTLLNCTDGVYSRHGLITIFTTNHIENIDPALLREGRIDKKIYVGNPTNNVVNDYIKTFFNDQECDSVIVPNKLSMSAIQEILLSHRNDKSSAIKHIDMYNKSKQPLKEKV